MAELGSCDGKISREHLISKSIITLLQGDGDFSVSGLPWLAADEIKLIGPNALTANCLCQKHNSALSPLDAAAFAFFSALKSCLDRNAASLQFLASGHDIERWLLKTAKALAASGNLARGRVSLSGAFASDVQVLDLLDEPAGWPSGAGLYCPMNVGEMTQNLPRFQLQPLTNARDEISGLAVSIMGLVFALMLEPLDLAAHSWLQAARFRPGVITINFPGSINRLKLCWEDGKPHPDGLNLTLLRPVDPSSGPGGACDPAPELSDA